MAFVHGKGTGVLVGAYDLTSYFNNAAPAKTVDASEVTTFGRDDKVYIAGREGGTLSLGGFFDGDANAVDDRLTASFGAQVPISVAWSGFATLGNPAVILQARETSYDITSPAGDAVSVTAQAEADGGVRMGGVVVAPLAARTSTGALTSVDGSASSAFGAKANLHVTAFTGTNVTIKVQHSADNSTFADLITFDSVTGVTTQHSTVSGTVNRYVRVNVTAGTFTSVTFAVVFARNKR